MPRKSVSSFANGAVGDVCVKNLKRPSLSQKPISLSKKLLVAASITAVTAALPGAFGVYGGRARAQALPAGCTDGGNDIAENGETVNCLAPPSPIGTISTNVSDLTIIVGNGATPTPVSSGTGDGIAMIGGGSQSLYIYNAGSTVTTTGDAAIEFVTNGAGSARIFSEADVTGFSNGVRVFHTGTGGVDIDIENATGTAAPGSPTSNGLSVYSGPASTGDLSIVANNVYGGNVGIDTNNDGSGAVYISVNNATGTDVIGLRGDNSSAGTSVTINSTGTVYGGQIGISGASSGSGFLDINAVNVTGGSGDAINAYHSSNGTGDLSITTTGIVMAGNVGIYADNDSSGSTYIDTSAGSVTGTFRGIESRHGGAATHNITTADVTATNDIGITGITEGGVGDLNINTTAGTVGAGSFGILAQQFGSGATSIATADVSSTNSIGIDAFVFTGGSTLDVDTSAGTVSAAGHALRLRHFGTAADTIVNVNNASGDTDDSSAGDGVNIYHEADAGDVTVSIAGNVAGHRGLYIDNQSNTGETTVTLGSSATVTGKTAEGILASSIYNTSHITVQGSSGDVVGATDGINLTTMGADILVQNLDSVTGNAGDGLDLTSAGGAITVTGIDTILGTGGNGIYANSDDGDVSIQGVGLVGGVTGTGAGGYGIYVLSGTGAINIGDVIGIGDVTATGIGDGIRVNQSIGAVDDLTINTTGAVVTGAFGGINAISRSTGDMFITTGDVTGNFTNAIFARVFNDSTILIDTTAGEIDGAGGGIFAQVLGTGDISIFTGDVNSSAGAGVATVNIVGGGDFAIDTTAGSVTGDTIGINATQSGVGVISISAADVTGTTSYGIRAFNNGASTGDVSISSTGIVTGASYGIGTYNYGSGALNIDVADVTSSGGTAIRSTSNGSGSTITSTGTLSGGSDGIFHEEYGNGAATINVNDVTGTSRYGIYAQTIGSTTSLSITSTGTVSGGTTGIYATHSGSGDLTINTQDTVTGDSTGIFALNYGSAAISVTTTDVNATTGTGIFAYNRGASSTDVTVDTTAGAVVSGNYGILARNLGTGDISITTADVTSQTTGAGVFAGNSGANLTIDTTAGTVTSTQVGVRAVQYTGTGVVTVTTGAVIGGDDGVYVLNNGTGATSISVMDVTGGNHGVSARNQNIASSAALTIDTTAGTVDGNVDGINAIHRGDGDLTITTGDVTGQTDDGVYAWAVSGNLSINTTGGTITSGDDGISAYAYVGSLTITTGDIVAGGYGLYADNLDGTDLTINTTGGTINSYDEGIYVYTGLGVATITTGDVTSTNWDGIDINHYGTSFTMTTNGDVSGGFHGIDFDTYGAPTGDIVITTNGDVTGVEDGINADNDPTNDDLILNLNGDVSGGERGIEVDGKGAGDVTVTAAGNVTGGNNDGLYAVNSPNGVNLTVTSTGSISGGYEGIAAGNFGSGAVSVTANNVTSTAGGDDAIEVYNSAAGTTMSITTTGNVTSADDDGIDAKNYGTDMTIAAGGTIDGFQAGIEAYNYGTGATTIAVTGSVTGQTEYGILAVTNNGADITVATGGSVTGATAAILADSGVAPGDPVDDTVTLESGGSINGDVGLLAGADTFNDQGGSFTNLFGGAGTDTANFDNAMHDVAGVGASTNAIEEVEIFNFNSGATGLTGTHVDVTMSTIAAGAILNARDGAVLSGLLTNNGTLNIGDSPGIFTVGGDFVQSATGVLPIEIDTTGFDQLIVGGAATLAGALDIQVAGGAGTGATTRTIIDAATGISGAFDTINSGLLISHTVDIDSVNFDANLTTTINTATSISGLTNNQTNLGNNLINLLSDPTLDPALVDLINATGAIADVATLGSTLDELGPEGLDMGLKFMWASQTRFVDLVLGQQGARHSNEPVRTASLNGGPVSHSSDGGPNVWGAFEAYGMSQDGDGAHIDFDGTAFSFAAGVSGIAAGPMSLGLAGGWSTFDGDIDGALGDQSDASLFHIAGTAQMDVELAGLDGALSTIVAFATGDNELTMVLNDPATSSPITQFGETDMQSVDWVTRFTLSGSNGESWGVKPYIQAGASFYSQDIAMLGTTGATALIVDSFDNTRWQVGLGATIDHQLSDRMMLHARAAGIQYFDDTDNAFATRFALAPTSTAFRTLGKEVDRQFQLDAAINYALKNGFTLSVGAFGELGDYNLYGGNVRLSKRF